MVGKAMGAKPSNEKNPCIARDSGGGRSPERTCLSSEIPATGKNTGNFTNFGGFNGDQSTENPDPEPIYGHHPALWLKSEQGFNNGVSGNDHERNRDTSLVAENTRVPPLTKYAVPLFGEAAPRSAMFPRQIDRQAPRIRPGITFLLNKRLRSSRGAGRRRPGDSTSPGRSSRQSHNQAFQRCAAGSHRVRVRAAR